ncbi:MAG: hypothetical protein IJV07_02930 [Alphaproteobacteria bacterium]|nr:hypothetical protein [Alphaproteobacteria bacterium]
MRLLLFIGCCLITLAAKGQLYGPVDARAKNAPTFETEQELVDYLTDGLTDEKLKTRALAAWIVYQMQRDGYRHKELIKYSHQNRTAPEPITNNPFQTRIGTSQDFARLFQTMGEAAGLTVATIKGYAGKNINTTQYQDSAYQAGKTLLNLWHGNSNSLQRYQASWNAVQIDKKWYLLDTYWMIANPNLFEAQNISSAQGMSLFLRRREKAIPGKAILTRGKRIDNHYFLAKPRFFIQTHFPLDEQWQLMPTPWTWSTFTNQ